MTEFDPWIGEPINETFGGKPLLNVGGRPMFLSAWKDDKYKNQVADPIADEAESCIK